MGTILKSRVCQLNGTEAELSAYRFTAIPQAGELIIYNPDYDATLNPKGYSYPRFKVGDGKTILDNLTFFTQLPVSYINPKLDSDLRKVCIDAGNIASYPKKSPTEG